MTFMELDETPALSGTAINATLGTIIRPIDIFQFGDIHRHPFQPPRNGQLQRKHEDGMEYLQYSPRRCIEQQKRFDGHHQLCLQPRTPWCVSGGATSSSERKGLQCRRRMAQLRQCKIFCEHFTGGNYDGDNNNIKTLYKSVLNLRMGR